MLTMLTHQFTPFPTQSDKNKTTPSRLFLSKYPIGIEPSCSLVLLPDAQSLDPAAASEHRNNVYHLRQQKKTARDPWLRGLNAFNLGKLSTPEPPRQHWSLAWLLAVGGLLLLPPVLLGRFWMAVLLPVFASMSCQFPMHGHQGSPHHLMLLMAHSVDTIPSKASGKKLHRTTSQKASQALSSLAVLSVAGGLLLLSRLLLKRLRQLCGMAVLPPGPGWRGPIHARKCTLRMLTMLTHLFTSFPTQSK